MKSTVLILIAIAVYLIGMLIIGFACSRKNKNTDDFYLGGRRLGPFVTAMSAEASDMSSWLLMGRPGLAMLTGRAQPTWTAVGLAVGTYLNWLIVAKRIRIYSHKINAITIPEFFSKRYKDDRHILSIIAALVIIVFFVPYTASGFAACGKLFSTVLGVDYMGAMIVCAVVICLYCVMGGFLAASTTDLVQSIVMTVALVIVIGYGEATGSAQNAAFGFDGIIESVKQLPGFLSLNSYYDASTNSAVPFGILPIASLLAWGLGYFGMPHVLLRFMAIDDAKKLKTSRRVATVWVIISMAVAVMIGITGYALVQSGVISDPSDPNKETIIITIAQTISKYGYIFALCAGVILAGILAATMSTADSQLLTAASGVTNDICENFLGIKLSNKKAMLVARLSVIGIAVLAVFFARDPDSSVFHVVSFAWAGFGASFGPVMLAALFWKRSTKWGAIAGMVSGGAMVFIWKYGISKLGGLFAIYELLPAFIFGLIVLIVVSLLTGQPDKEAILEFEETVKECKAK